MRITSGGDICDQGNDADLTDCASDERLKTNIYDYQYGLNEILQLHPVRFSWNSEAAKMGYDAELTTSGLIAQEVEAVIPGWVSENDRRYKKIPGS